MMRFNVEITDLTGKTVWQIIAANSFQAARTALRIAQIVGPFRMVTKVAP